MATEIAASRSAVWRALCDPAQVIRWRPGVSEALDPASGYPSPGQRMRWRCLLHDIPVVLEDTPRTVERGRRLESALALGLFRFEETFTLAQAEGAPERTRLTIKIAANSQMPVVGGTLDRFAVRRFAADLASVYLQAVRDWCERGQSAQLPLPDLPRGAGIAATGR